MEHEKPELVNDRPSKKLKIVSRTSKPVLTEEELVKEHINHEKPELISNRRSKRTKKSHPCTLKRRQQLLYDIVYDNVCLPKELIHLIASFDEPIVKSMREVRKIETYMEEPSLRCYKNEMYVFPSLQFGDASVDVLLKDGTKKRSFTIDLLCNDMNIIDDKIYKSKKIGDDYVFGIYDMDGKDLQSFSKIDLKKLIKINDQLFMGLCFKHGYLHTLNEKGEIVHKSNECGFNGLIHHDGLVYAYGDDNIVCYNVECNQIGSVDIANYCDDIYDMHIYRDMIIINGSYETNFGLYIFQMNGTFIHYHQMNGIGTIELMGDEIWVTNEHEPGITVLECIYKQ